MYRSNYNRQVVHSYVPAFESGCGGILGLPLSRMDCVELLADSWALGRISCLLFSSRCRRSHSRMKSGRSCLRASCRVRVASLEDCCSVNQHSKCLHMFT